MIRAKQPKSEIIIDLTGPQGNAFYLLGVAKNFCKQLDMTEKNTQSILDEMTSGDYENLIQVFDREFGSVVILER
ncbi:MAG: hypothetical protein HKN86_02450 [Acidimicrobiia bacterium]|nr:hypothetical protein [Acidimicrobiia bacterium]